MARYVKISTIGCELVDADLSLSYEDAKAYVEAYLAKHIAQVLPDRPDLILLPEMCDVPHNYDVPRRMDYLRRRGDAHIDFFAAIAKQNNCNLAYCTYRMGAGDYALNTVYVLDRAGRVAGVYNKNHVVVPSEIDQQVRCGTEAPIFDLDIGRVACSICFDLNFDVLWAHYKAQKPEIILFCSMYHGGIVQQLRAQSCRSYFVGAICDARPSAIISPIGEIVAYSTNYTNYATATVNLDYALAHFDYNQDKINDMKAKYGSKVTIFDPGNIGYFMLTSEHESLTIRDMIKEFGVTELDDYFAGALAAHRASENRCVAGKD